MSAHVRDKTVLVTGGCGFLGTHLCQLLQSQTPRILHKPRRNEVDFTNQTQTEEFFARIRPQTVVHLAAEVGGIEANRQNPGRFFYANMSMGINVIEAARKAGVERFLLAGTVCAYPATPAVPFKEEDLWNGYPEPTNAPYGIAKRALTVMLQAYRQQYGLNGLSVLPTNLYGPGDSLDIVSNHVIPALICKFLGARLRKAASVECWGSGEVSREFLHVKDCALGIVDALNQCEEAGPINLGTGQEIKIKELASLIAELTDFKGKIIWNTSKPDGQLRRRLDIAKASRLFSFSPQVPLVEGLRETILWCESQLTDL